MRGSSNRFCWRCVVMTAPPVLVLLVAGWWSSGRYAESLETLELDVGVLYEELDDLKFSNDLLRQELESATRRSADLKAAALAAESRQPTSPTTEELRAALAALPEEARRALLSEWIGDAEPR